MSSSIVTCRHCGAKNRIPPDKPPEDANCGRCHQPLMGPSAQQGAESPKITLRCGQCRTKNRVPVSKLHEGAKCGRCGALLPHGDVLTGRPVLVSDTNFEHLVLRSPLPVLLYSWAPWCSVCSGINAMVDQLADEVKGKFRIGKLNVDANPKLAGQFNILSVPTFFVFDGGELKQHLPGAVPRHELLLKMAFYIYA
ncbi:thioredoxin family protein [Desulfatitalea tepidiphila]|uniref:thioredoxin family protein n=1 Tax=Desulfatitalea tepidiphila TaxID=1185843 RepID=UPI0009FAC0A2|nr:thioredoxin domain-containing protein [Desulfatitalea tepidiphila]